MDGKINGTKSLFGGCLGIELGKENYLYAHILERMRQAVAADKVYLSFHANKELKADKLKFDDVLNCILTGEIIEQQLDDGEEKYLVYGDSCDGNEVAVVAKLSYNESTLVITVFRLRFTDYDF